MLKFQIVYADEISIWIGIQNKFNKYKTFMNPNEVVFEEEKWYCICKLNYINVVY